MIGDIGYLAVMERSAGRPRIGTAVHIRLPDELLARVDQLAETWNVTRAEMLRYLLDDGLRYFRSPPTNEQPGADHDS